MDWGLLVAIAALVLTAAGGLAVWAIRFGKAETSSETARMALERAESVERDLADFRERVARDYATAEMVAAVERNMTYAINRLTDRIDRVLEYRTPYNPNG